MPAIQRIALILFTFCLMAFSQGGIQQDDDQGHTIQLAQPAQRIVSLAPHLTEMLFAIGAGGQVVGVVSYSNYPAAAREITRVGRYDKLDIETIVALKPDLIVAWESGNSPQQLEQLRQLGFTVFVNRPRRMLDIPATMKRLGVLSGHASKAQQVARQLQQRYQQQVARYAQKRPVTVFYQIWAKPLMTLNGEHIFSDMLHSCGAVNVFAELSVLAAQVSTEAVISRDPELILVSGMGQASPEALDTWRQWPQLQAVKAGNLFYINPDLIQRSGPRLFDGQEQLCAMIDEARNKREQHAEH